MSFCYEFPVAVETFDFLVSGLLTLNLRFICGVELLSRTL